MAIQGVTPFFTVTDLTDNIKVLIYRSVLPFTPTPSYLFMLSTIPLLSTFFLALASHGWPETSELRSRSEIPSTCARIAAAISSASQVFFPRAHDIFSRL